MNETFSNISAYLAEISRIPLLSAQGERELARRIHKGDERAHQAFIEANLRLVVHVARQYAGGDPEKLMDLIQEGNLGLFRAVDRFNPELGYRFSTYAMYWIRQAIRRYIMREPAIRLPEHVAADVNRMRRVRHTLFQELGRHPAADEVAAEMGVPEGHIHKLEEYSQATVSLDQAVGEDEDDGTMLGELLRDLEAPQPEFIASQHLLRARVRDVVSELPAKERDIVRMRFGLQDNIPHTLEEVGREFGVTRERIRQIQNKALERLRRHVGLNGRAAR